jgi:hypothetical protein
MMRLSDPIELALNRVSRCPGDPHRMSLNGFEFAVDPVELAAEFAAETVERFAHAVLLSDTGRVDQACHRPGVDGARSRAVINSRGSTLTACTEPLPPCRSGK